MSKDCLSDSDQTQSSTCTTLANSLMLTVFAVVFKKPRCHLVSPLWWVSSPSTACLSSINSLRKVSVLWAQSVIQSWICSGSGGFIYSASLFFGGGVGDCTISQQKHGRIIVCFVANTSQTINKALIHRSEIISCSPKPIGHINTSIKALGYELNITRPRAGAKVMERSEECHDRAISAC